MTMYIKRAVLWVTVVTIAMAWMPVFAATDDPDRNAIEVSTDIFEASVFPTMAQVERKGVVNLKARGMHTLDLTGLSDQLNIDSFQVGGKGTAKIRIIGSSLERVFSTRDVDSEIAVLVETVEKLQREDNVLVDAIEAAAAEKKFVYALQSTYSQEASKNMANRPLRIKDWKNAGAFVHKRLQELSAAMRDNEYRRADIRKKITEAQSQLNALRSKSGHWTIVAHVDIEVLSPGSFTVNAKYLLPNAYWSMTYDARLNPGTSNVEVGCYATIVQNTGEDWKNVTLVLSTAQPSVSGTIPELYPRYIDFYHPRTYNTRTLSDERELYGEKAMAEAAPASVMQKKEMKQGDFDQPEMVAEMAQATVETVGMTTFTAPRRTDIPSDNQVHKVFLLSKSWKAETHYEVIPALSQYAYLAAKTTNNFDFPLLAGTLSIYMGENFVGRADIKTTQAGDELLLPFGIDERIKVERVLLNRKEKEQGIINKDTVLTYKYRISVTNTDRNKAATIRMYEQLPISNNKEIVVKKLKNSDKGWKKHESTPGIMVWDGSVAPGKKKDIRFDFVIEYPKGKQISGAP